MCTVHTVHGISRRCTSFKRGHTTHGVMDLVLPQFDVFFFLNSLIVALESLFVPLRLCALGRTLASELRDCSSVRLPAFARAHGPTARRGTGCGHRSWERLAELRLLIRVELNKLPIVRAGLDSAQDRLGFASSKLTVPLVSRSILQRRLLIPN